LNVDTFSRPLTIHSLRDGGVYFRPAALRFSQTNLFLNVGRIDELYIKTPSPRGMEDYRRFAKFARSSSEEIRPIDESERFENVSAAIQRFPELKPISLVNIESAHYLAIHKMQFERLRTQTGVGIPEARFGLLAHKQLRIFDRFEPALFQERVPGATLWSMFDFAALRVTSQWREFLPAISSTLSELLASRLRDHIDWNIQNFVFDRDSRRLFYVDSKPTVFLSKESNELNLKGIQHYFL
jgi:hypothetical protein